MYNRNDYEMLIRNFHVFVNWGISIKMDLCYNGNGMDTQATEYISQPAYIYISIYL